MDVCGQILNSWRIKAVLWAFDSVTWSDESTPDERGQICVCIYSSHISNTHTLPEL